MTQVLDFFLVLAIATGIASGVGCLYATGLRLWIASAPNGTVVRRAPRVGAVVCFGICIVVILFALDLIIPFFHQG